MLIQLPDVLVADEVRHARQLLATASWVDGRPGAGSQAIQVKNNEQLPHTDPVAQAVREMVLRGLDRHPIEIANGQHRGAGRFTSKTAKNEHRRGPAY